MKQALLRYTGAVAILISLASIAEGADYKRLTTQWKGPDIALDVINGGARNNFVRLAKKEDVSGQSWKITKADEWLNLTTEFRGDRMCLDVENGGSMNNFVKLEKCENNSGQSWKITKSKDDGYVRLSTEFRGSNMCLDIVNGGSQDGLAKLAKCEDVSGQLWKIADSASAETPSPAVPARAASASSTHIVKAMTFPGDGDVPPQSVFKRETLKILLALEVRDVKPEDKLVVNWIAEKAQAVPPNFAIFSGAIPLGASSLVSSSISKPDAGWPPGQYRVDITYNGGPVEFSQRFSITD